MLNIDQHAKTPTGSRSCLNAWFQGLVSRFAERGFHSGFATQLSNPENRIQSSRVTEQY
jgi:hypothetical protein